MCLLAVLAAPAVGAPICRVTDHGARGDGKTLDTRALQAAVDACAGRGGGTVVVPGPAVYSTGTILLKDGVTLHLEAGAVLQGTRNLDDYVVLDPFVDGVGATRGACLIGADGARDIAITGQGTIDGQGHLWERGAPDHGRRPMLVRLVRSRNIVLRGVTLTRPAAWTCNLYQCRRVRIEGVSIDAHVNSNNDGIDLDGCRDVQIRRCRINSGDDAVCFKTTSRVPNEDITVTDSDLTSHWGAFKWGTESLGDMRGFRIERCRIRDTRGGGFKILSADGARIEDIRIRDVALENVDMPVSILLRSRLRAYRDQEARGVGAIRDVEITGLTGVVPDDGRVAPSSAILVSGLPGHPVERIRIRDVRLSLPGGGTRADAERVVPLLERAYPEYRNLGVLPALGAFVRHARGLRLDRVMFDRRRPDERPHIYQEDAADLEVNGRRRDREKLPPTAKPPASPSPSPGE